MTLEYFHIYDPPPMAPDAALRHLRFRLGNPTALRDAEGLEALETVRWLIETNKDLRFAAEAELSPTEAQQSAAVCLALNAANPGVHVLRRAAPALGNLIVLLYRERQRAKAFLSKDYMATYLSSTQDSDTRIVDVWVCHARKLLKTVAPDCPSRGIVTVWGRGYRLSDDAIKWVAGVLGDTPPSETETQA